MSWPNFSGFHSSARLMPTCLWAMLLIFALSKARRTSRNESQWTEAPFVAPPLATANSQFYIFDVHCWMTHLTRLTCQYDADCGSFGPESERHIFFVWDLVISVCAVTQEVLQQLGVQWLGNYRWGRDGTGEKMRATLAIKNDSCEETLQF